MTFTSCTVNESAVSKKDRETQLGILANILSLFVVMSSVVFELDSPARAICGLPPNFFGNEENDSHYFVLGTSNCFSDSRICIIEYQEESNNVFPLKSWNFPEEVLSLSTPLESEKPLFSVVFSSFSELYEIVEREHKLLISLSTSYSQILWPADKRGEGCVAVLEKSIFALDLKDGRDGESFLLFQYNDRKINCMSLDPFHSSNCLCGTNNGLSLIDLRSGKDQIHYSFSSGGVNPVRCVDFSPANPGRFLATGLDGIIRVYDTRMNLEISKSSFLAHGHTVHKALFNPFHDNLVISGSSDQSLRLWDLSTKGDQVPIQSTNDFQDSVANVCWSNTSPWIFAGLSYNGKVIVDTVLDEKKMSILLEEDI